MHPEFNPGTCDRCGFHADQRWPCHYLDDYDGRERKIMICWDCDFDVSNGRGRADDPMDEVLIRRQEEYRELYPLG